jgi:uncharacterized phage-associated protein
MQLAKQVDPIAGVRIKKLQKAMAKVGLDSVHDMPLYDMILIILRRFQTVSMFKLTKLLYLSDLLALNEMGRTISGEIYLRQQEGPWLPSLKKIIDSIKNEEVLITRKRALPYILLRSDNGKDITLNEKEASIVLDAIERYGKMNDAEIKTATYLSAPMRYILRQEKLGRDMRRVPVIYKDKHAIDLDSVSPKEIK